MSFIGVMKEFQVTLYFTLFLLGWANAADESRSGFIFRCVDKLCSEPIFTARARLLYNPDHDLKMRLSTNDSVSIHGVSDLTELVLVNCTTKNPKLVSPRHLSFDKKMLYVALKRAKESVSVNLPSRFAKKKNVPVKEELSSVMTENSWRNVSRPGVRLRMFLEVVLNRSSFKREGKPVVNKETIPNEEKDGNDAAEDFYGSLIGNEKTSSAGTDRTTNSNDGSISSGLQSSEYEDTKKEDGIKDDSLRKPDVVEDGTLKNVDQNSSKIVEESSVDTDNLNATQAQNSIDVRADNETINSPNLSAQNESVTKPNTSEVGEDPASMASVRAQSPNLSEPTPTRSVPDGSEPLESQPESLPSEVVENEQVNDTSISDTSTLNNDTSMANEDNLSGTTPTRSIPGGSKPLESQPESLPSEVVENEQVNDTSISDTSTLNNDTSMTNATDKSHTSEVANKTTNSYGTDPLKEKMSNEEQKPTEETSNLENFENTTASPGEVRQSVASDNEDSATRADVMKTSYLEHNTILNLKRLPPPFLKQPGPSGVDRKNSEDINGIPSDATTPGPEHEDEVTPRPVSPPLDGDIRPEDVTSDLFSTSTPLDYLNSDQSLPEVEKSTEVVTEGDQSFDGGMTDERAVDEKSFYAIVVEYISTFTVSIPNFGDWFSLSKSENTSCDQDDCDAMIVIPMAGVDLGLGARPIRIPFWGEITAAEREKISTYAIVFLLTVFLVICSTFSVFSREWKKKEKKLVAFVNRLEGKLLVSTREISSLEERVCNVKTRTMDSTVNADKMEAVKEAFNKQLKHYQVKNNELEDKVTYLEKELESVQHYALEMHKLFENSLTTQSTSRAAIDEVDELRMLTERQENEIDDLRRQMDTILIENQILKEASENMKSMSKKLEQDYNVQMKKNLELSEKQKELTFRLEKEIDNSLTLENDYKSQIYQLHSKLEEVEMKLKRSEFQVEEMSRVITQKKDTGDWETSSDDGMLKVQVSTLEAMNLDLTNQLKEEKGARRMVEDHMGSIIKELNALKKTFEVSEKERNEAVTKLQVLTDYFNNEKTKIQKELEAKEKLLTENENKDQLLSRTMQSLKEEINNYKLQNEALKKEINEQEVSFKIQLAKAEQKGRDDWFALRKTERKYKECQQEAATLRNRILMLESNTDQKEDEKNINGMNGDLSTPPPPLTYPIYSPEILPLPSDFMPTPPTPPLPSHSVEFDPPMPPLYSSDERLPPLGGRRVPSPSNSNPCDDDEFTPPPPLPGYQNLPNRSRNEISSSYMRTTPHSGRQRSSQFRPRRQRNSVDSPSSGMSVESLDKSGR